MAYDYICHLGHNGQNHIEEKGMGPTCRWNGTDISVEWDRHVGGMSVKWDRM